MRCTWLAYLLRSLISSQAIHSISNIYIQYPISIFSSKQLATRWYVAILSILQALWLSLCLMVWYDDMINQSLTHCCVSFYKQHTAILIINSSNNTLFRQNHSIEFIIVNLHHGMDFDFFESNSPQIKMFSCFLACIPQQEKRELVPRGMQLRSMSNSNRY